MREFISESKRKEIIKATKQDATCCLVKLNGKKLRTKELYYDKLKEKLQLNESFSNNYNSYSDMMRDPFTYYNKDKIVFVIKHYEMFLSEDTSKAMIEKIFDDAIIPFFQGEIEEVVHQGSKKEIHVYCVL
jgi:RNAse (barnase) inhibitor barstar